MNTAIKETLRVQNQKDIRHKMCSLNPTGLWTGTSCWLGNLLKSKRKLSRRESRMRLSARLREIRILRRLRRESPLLIWLPLVWKLSSHGEIMRLLRIRGRLRIFLLEPMRLEGSLRWTRILPLDRVPEASGATVFLNGKSGSSTPIKRGQLTLFRPLQSSSPSKFLANLKLYHPTSPVPKFPKTPSIWKTTLLFTSKSQRRVSLRPMGDSNI